MTEKNKTAFLQEIHIVLDEIRPHLAVDGGNVQVVDVSDDMDVKIRWEGNCEFCSMSDMTLRAGIEQTLKSKFPKINSVIAVNGQKA